MDRELILYTHIYTYTFSPTTYVYMYIYLYTGNIRKSEFSICACDGLLTTNIPFVQNQTSYRSVVLRLFDRLTTI